MSGQHSRRARAALAQMTEVDPAIAALALWCGHRDHDEATTTSGDTIYYGPSFEDHSLPEQIGLVAHHVLHVALRHSARQGDMGVRLGTSFKPKLYNLASDAIVNEVLLEGGHALPRPAVLAKEVIDLLPGFDTVATNVLADWDTERLYHALAKPLEGDPSKTTSSVDEYMLKRRFAPDLTTSGNHEAEADMWSNRVDQALDLGRSAGIGIGPKMVRFGDLPASRTPWELRLRRLLAKAVSDVPRLSYKRPSSRWVAREAHAVGAGATAPVFEPGYSRDVRQPRIVVALDTSSSVTDTQLDLFAAEVLGIERRSAAELHVLGFDTEVHSQFRMRDAGDLKRLDIRRGGGTDFAPVIECAKALDPSLCIILTDLDAPFPPDPKFSVIWCVPNPVRHIPAFGTVLQIDV